jgi:hypothetical protein
MEFHFCHYKYCLPVITKSIRTEALATNGLIHNYDTSVRRVWNHFERVNISKFFFSFSNNGLLTGRMLALKVAAICKLGLFD